MSPQVCSGRYGGLGLGLGLWLGGSGEARRVGRLEEMDLGVRFHSGQSPQRLVNGEWAG
jgi:hypothetical protein